MTDIEYEPHYHSLFDRGPAVRVDAGVSSGGLIATLNKVGMVAVGGACSTVGVAGGHTPGGGHSILSSLYRLGADNTLEFEVIIANGTTVTASPTQNADLYWALSGGGSGNYGIVWSMTVKTFPDMKIAAASLNFTSTNHTLGQFLEAMGARNSLAPNITQAGAWAYANFVLLANNQATFILDSVTGPNLTVSQLHDFLAPFLQKLKSLGFPYTYNASYHDSYLDAYESVLPVWPVGGVFGSRLIPRKTIEQDGKGLLAVEETILRIGDVVSQLIFKADRPSSSNQDNAVLPAWRNNIIHMISGGALSNGARNYSEMVERQANITNIVLPALEKLVTDSGAYMNEGDKFDPKWKANFYGSNYDRLLQVKHKWDPTNVFWVAVGVGSDALKENTKQLLYPSSS